MPEERADGLTVKSHECLDNQLRHLLGSLGPKSDDKSLYLSTRTCQHLGLGQGQGYGENWNQNELWLLLCARPGAASSPHPSLIAVS